MSDVVMPQMGESIAEGTIVRWIKKVGERVDRDEPLFEISTDKVDAEIQSPAAGVLVEIRAKEGETVPVNSVVAVIGEAGAAVAAVPVKADVPVQAPAPTPAPKPAPAAPVPLPPPAHAVAPPAEAADQGAPDGQRQKSSPLVRKIAQEHNLELGRVPGTGLGGRVTKDDILGYLGKGERRAAPRVLVGAPQAAIRVPAFKPGDNVEVVALSVMRKKIAEHMVFSRWIFAHVHSVFEVDYIRVAKIREARKVDYER